MSNHFHSLIENPSPSIVQINNNIGRRLSDENVEELHRLYILLYNWFATLGKLTYYYAGLLQDLEYCIHSSDKYSQEDKDELSRYYRELNEKFTVNCPGYAELVSCNNNLDNILRSFKNRSAIPIDWLQKNIVKDIKGILEKAGPLAGKVFTYYEELYYEQRNIRRKLYDNFGVETSTTII